VRQKSEMICKRVEEKTALKDSEFAYPKTQPDTTPGSAPGCGRRWTICGLGSRTKR
jgi:hypothetical protein